ncbi:MAG: hypothetical protein M1825_001432 [Sarcosagium campestre]|nr:MAG: hypothetical protein M1825_001432 [Sarcosagium campestre]
MTEKATTHKSNHHHHNQHQNSHQHQSPHSASQPSATKRDLTSWWRRFNTRIKREEEKAGEPSGIFGVPLQNSIKYANVAISLTDAEGKSFIYGYVPIVVAKCGVFLKEKATDVEGIFRLSGSAKRIKDLQVLFDSPDRYGKGLDWSGFTVHDAANILRRYLNNLPEPIIPLDYYDRFRDPLRNHEMQAVGDTDAAPHDIGGFDESASIKKYQQLIIELPPLSRQLLLYILDLLAVFASKSDLNRMNATNLAAIFQPGILSHPAHDMAPKEYRLSQDVLVFLIDNQDHFLIGMRGTAADEDTVKEVQSGGTPQATTPTTPVWRKSTVGRTSSTASAGAESIRKYGGVRRNVSVSSKTSRQSSGAPSPASPGYTSSPMSTGVHRSNTLPSKKSPGLPSPRFLKSTESPSQPLASPGNAPVVPASTSFTEASSSDGPPAIEPRVDSQGEGQRIPSNPERIQSEGGKTATQGGFADTTKQTSSSAGQGTPFLETPADVVQGQTSSSTPLKDRGIAAIFTRSPTSDNERREGRQANKLRKKRAPEANNDANTSAQSSTHSLNVGS